MSNVNDNLPFYPLTFATNCKNPACNAVLTNTDTQAYLANHTIPMPNILCLKCATAHKCPQEAEWPLPTVTPAADPGSKAQQNVPPAPPGP